MTCVYVGRVNVTQLRATCGAQELARRKVVDEASAGKTDVTLYDCLDAFTQEEELGADDLWYASKAGQPAKLYFDPMLLSGTARDAETINRPPRNSTCGGCQRFW